MIYHNNPSTLNSQPHDVDICAWSDGFTSAEHVHGIIITLAADTEIYITHRCIFTRGVRTYTHTHTHSSTHVVYTCMIDNTRRHCHPSVYDMRVYFRYICSTFTVRRCLYTHTHWQHSHVKRAASPDDDDWGHHPSIGFTF